MEGGDGRTLHCKISVNSAAAQTSCNTLTQAILPSSQLHEVVQVQLSKQRPSRLHCFQLLVFFALGVWGEVMPPCAPNGAREGIVCTLGFCEVFLAFLSKNQKHGFLVLDPETGVKKKTKISAVQPPGLKKDNNHAFFS